MGILASFKKLVGLGPPAAPKKPASSKPSTPVAPSAEVKRTIKRIDVLLSRQFNLSAAEQDELHQLLGKQGANRWYDPYIDMSRVYAPGEHMPKPQADPDTSPARWKASQPEAIADRKKTMPKRQFVMNDGKSNKFWEVSRENRTMLVSFGRVGTQGQTQKKVFPSNTDAEAAVYKLIDEKLKKGYVEV